MSGERRCEVRDVPFGYWDVTHDHFHAASRPCGALVEEGRCRTPMHHPRDRAMHEQYDYGHAYDGWVCEAGHPVAAEVVQG